MHQRWQGHGKGTKCSLALCQLWEIDPQLLSFREAVSLDIFVWLTASPFLRWEVKSELPYPFTFFRTVKELITCCPGQEVTRWPPQLQLCTFTSILTFYIFSFTVALYFGTAIQGHTHSGNTKSTFPYTGMIIFSSSETIKSMLPAELKSYFPDTQRKEKCALYILYLLYFQKQQEGSILMKVQGRLKAMENYVVKQSPPTTAAGIIHSKIWMQIWWSRTPYKEFKFTGIQTRKTSTMIHHWMNDFQNHIGYIYQLTLRTTPDIYCLILDYKSPMFYICRINYRLKNEEWRQVEACT